MKKCIVIGSGLGGLSAAIRLVLQGLEVHVYEKNDSCGGKANELKTNGFRFDTGPSLVTMPFVMESLFSDAGKKLSDYITIESLERHCRYFYTDGTTIDAHKDVHDFSREIQGKTIDSSSAVEKYLQYTSTIYDLTANLFLFNDFHEISTFVKNKDAKNTLFNIRKIDSMRTVHKANSSFFNDKKTIQLFDRYATYNGSNPYRAPATLNIIPHVEYNMGSFIIKEGIYELVRAMEKLAGELGVVIHLNRKVTSILVDKKRVKGVYIKDDFAGADIIVSNADVTVTYNSLLKNKKSRSSRKYNRLEPSSSAVVFLWGIKGKHENLGIHNIFFSENYKLEFHELFEDNKCPGDATIYVYISSKFNEKDAPAGCENWFVMINAPYRRDDANHEDYNLRELRNAIIKKINDQAGVDLSSKILHETISTPIDIEKKTGSNRGSIYGISSNSRTAAFMRQSNRSRDYRGLYFCGGSAHPGGGIPLVMLSGKIVSDLVRKYEL
ncbi:phytoene desaturase family protein [Spirochaetota bacterium]